MFTMIAAALGLLGTLAGIAWKWKAANSSSAADKAASAEATDANAMTKASANITDTTRATVQEKLDANTTDTARVADAVRSADSLQSGADALNAAIAAANRPKD
jgi:hypothetical protein